MSKNRCCNFSVVLALFLRCVCVREVILYVSRYLCFVARNVPLRHWALGKIYFRTFYTGEHFGLVFHFVILCFFFQF